MHLTELWAEDIQAIDAAGAAGQKKITVRNGLRKLGMGILIGIGILGACSYFEGRIRRRNIRDFELESESLLERRD